ncbi:MAG: PF20097 family protein [Candidatus Hodarchaeota archaeon]
MEKKLPKSSFVDKCPFCDGKLEEGILAFAGGFEWVPKSGDRERKWMLLRDRGQVRAARCKICGIMMFNYGTRTKEELIGRIFSKIDITKHRTRH